MRRTHAIGRGFTLIAMAFAAVPETNAGLGSSTPLSCDIGAATGTWVLATPGHVGRVAGILTSPTSTTAYRLNAVLTDVVSPCVSCLEGALVGTLDDGVGTGPDFAVDGRYFGGFLSGQGHFRAQIRRIATAEAIGAVGGEFNDPAIDPTPGTFAGRWKLCP